jgi:hypothetical protein
MDRSTSQILSEQNIHLGAWTNWSKGRISGATITLTTRNGGFLIAFIALAIHVTGSCFWMLCTFLLHRCFSTKNRHDSIYHQRQAMLRNATGSFGTFWRALRLFWIWRKHEKVRLVWRTVPLMLFSGSVFLAFAIAGVLSSRIATTAGGEVLVRSPDCGLLRPDWSNNSYTALLLRTYTQQRAEFSSIYANLCYGNTSWATECSSFPRSKLDYNVTKGIDCPFPGGDKICSANGIRFDTGFIDSNQDLGINTRDESRFLYRTVNECAPLKTDGYTSTISRQTNLTNFNESNIGLIHQYATYLFGPSFSFGNTSYEYNADPPNGAEAGWRNIWYNMAYIYT